MTDADIKAFKTLTTEQALCIMNRLTCISNDLASEKPGYGWFEMGRFIEALSQKISSPISQAAFPQVAIPRGISNES